MSKLHAAISRAIGNMNHTDRVIAYERWGFDPIHDRNTYSPTFYVTYLGGAPSTEFRRADGKQAVIQLDKGNRFAVYVDGEWRGAFDRPEAAFLVGFGRRLLPSETSDFMGSIYDMCADHFDIAA